MSYDVQQSITDSIIASIETGAGTFSMPWHAANGGMPSNVLTGKTYRGANVLSLWFSAKDRGYRADTWGTYRQWQAKGGQVRKGETGTTTVFYKTCAKPGSDPKDSDSSYFLARASSVFNAAQVDGIESAPAEQARPDLTESLAHCDAFIAATGATVNHGGTKAYYRPSQDLVQMPDRDLFTGTATSTATQSYYAVLLHELTHWTGAPNRLDRVKGKRYGDNAYAYEELVAEIGAAFLCAELGITPAPRIDHAQYIASWLTVLKGDKKAIFKASSDASKAAAYLQAAQGAPKLAA